MHSFPFPYPADRESAELLRVPSGSASSCLAPQQKADAVDVRGDNGERDDAGKARGAVCPNPVEAAVLEVLDRRFHGRMLTPHRHEFFAPLALPLSLVQVAYLWQHVVIEQYVEVDPALGAVRAAVEAHRAEIGIPFLGSLHDRHCIVHIVALLYDRMVKDETVPVFQNADRNAEFHPASGLAFRDPARVRFEDRKHVLALRDHFPSSRRRSTWSIWRVACET